MFKMNATSIPVDNKVVDKIKECLSKGLTRVIEMNNEVKKFSKKEFFGRTQPNTPFFPSTETLSTCIHRLLMERRFSKLKEDGVFEVVNTFFVYTRGINPFYGCQVQ